MENTKDLVTVKVQEAFGWKLNYLFSKLAKYEPRSSWNPDSSTIASFTEWQGYERGWGNPIPDYVAGEISSSHLSYLLDNGFMLQKADGHFKYKCWKVEGDKVIFGYGDTPTEAIMRTCLIDKFGDTMQVIPEYDSIPVVW